MSTNFMFDLQMNVCLIIGTSQMSTIYFIELCADLYFFNRQQKRKKKTQMYFGHFGLALGSHTAYCSNVNLAF